MSGGSMDYLYSLVGEARFRLDTPERKAFAAHLKLVAKAMHDIEWVDSGDCRPGIEDAAIRACLADGAVLSELISEAEAIKLAIDAEIARAVMVEDET